MQVKIDNRDDIRIIRMQRPPVNALNGPMVEDLLNCLEGAEDDGNVSGIILTGINKYFSAGLDVIELFPKDKISITRFWNRFFTLLRKLYTCPKPVFSAITGHSPAGGTVMAIMSDYRIMASGKFTIGLNEVNVGLIIPASIADIFSNLIGRRNAELLALNGSLISPDDAVRYQLVDEICPPEEVLDRAIQKMRSWLLQPSLQQSKTKMEFRKNIITKMEARMDIELKTITDIWFSKGFQSAMGRLVENLSSGKESAI